jgi:hypothetical protein
MADTGPKSRVGEEASVVPAMCGDGRRALSGEAAGRGAPH